MSTDDIVHSWLLPVTTFTHIPLLGFIFLASCFDREIGCLESSICQRT